MRGAGFTLRELVCTLAVAGVVLGLTVPTFTEVMLDSRRTADINALVLAVQLARSEVAKRNRPVIVCATADTSHCDGDAGRFELGWMVFVNLDDRYPPQRSADEPLLYSHTPGLSGTIRSNRPYYEFRVRRRSINGTVIFCDRRGAVAARAVIVSYTGKPRVSERDADRRPLACA